MGGSFSSELLIDLLSQGGKLGVDLFVLISGYFLVKSSFKTKSFLKVLCATLFYAIVLGIIFCFVPNGEWSLKSAITGLTIDGFPWFVTVYLGLYLTFPFINIFISHLNCKQYKSILVLGALLFCVIPTLPGFSFIYSSYIWFVYLYLCAGYIRLFGIPKVDKKVGIIAIMSAGFLILWVVGVNVAENLTGIPVAKYASYFRGLNSVPVFALAISLFELFRKINLGNSRVVNTISATTFGIYLIHDNKFVRPWLWDFFSGAYYLPAPLFVVCALVSTVVIFAVCAAIEMCKLQLARLIKDKIKISLISKLENKIDNWYAQFRIS